MFWRNTHPSQAPRAVFLVGVAMLAASHARPTAAFCIVNASRVDISISQRAGHAKGGRLSQTVAAGERYCRNWKDARTNARGDRQARLRFRVSTIHAPAKKPSLSIGGIDVPIPTPRPGPTQVDVGVSETICEAWVGAAQTLTVRGRPGKVVGSRVRGGRWTCSDGSEPQHTTKRPPAPPPPRHVTRPAIPPPARPGPTRYRAQGASPAQCSHDYQSCMNDAQHCGSAHAQRYQQCADGLADKLDECNRWHQRKSGSNTYGPTQRGPSRKPSMQPECLRFQRVEAYCGKQYSAQCDQQKAACDVTLRQCQASIAPEHPVGEAPPPMPPPPAAWSATPAPATESRGYALSVRNDCDKDTSVAYHYRGLNGDWTTAGWVNPVAGTTESLPITTETPEIYLHTTAGTFSHSNPKHNRLVLDVINPTFSYVYGQRAVEGAGKRALSFERFGFSDRPRHATAVVICPPGANPVATPTPPPRYAHTVEDQPMFQAAVNNDWTRVKKLIASGEPIDIRSRRYGSLLYIAAVTGSDAIVPWLLEQGAVLNPAVPVPPAALHLDIRNSGAALDRFLEPSHTGPLAAAIWRGRSAVAKQLIEAGPDVASLGAPEQASLVAGAAYQGLPDVLRVLKVRGVDLTQADAHGRNAAHWAVNTHNLAYKRMTGTLDTLKAAGVDLDAPDAGGMTPLLYAAHYGDLEHVKWLLAQGADPTRSTTSGRTFAELAQYSRNPALVKFLSGLNKSP